MFVIILLMLSLVVAAEREYYDPSTWGLGTPGQIKQSELNDHVIRLWQDVTSARGPNADVISGEVGVFAHEFSKLTPKQQAEIFEKLESEPEITDSTPDYLARSRRRQLYDILTTHDENSGLDISVREHLDLRKKLIESFRTASDEKQAEYLGEIFEIQKGRIDGGVFGKSNPSNTAEEKEEFQASIDLQLKRMNEGFLAHLDNKQRGIVMTEQASTFGTKQTITIPENLGESEFKYGIDRSDETPYEDNHLRVPNHFSITQNEKIYVIPTELPDNVGKLDVRTLDDGSVRDISYTSTDGKNNARLSDLMYLSHDTKTDGSRGQAPNKWTLNAGVLNEESRRTVITLDPKATKENPSIVKITNTGSTSEFESGRTLFDKSIRIQMWGDGHLNSDPNSDQFKVTIGDRSFFPSKTGRAGADGSKYGMVEALQGDVFAVEGNIQTSEIGILMKAYDGQGLVDFGTDGALFSRIYEGHKENVAERLKSQGLELEDFTILRVAKKEGETRQVTGSLEGLQDKVLFSVAEKANLQVTKVDGSKGSINIAGNPADNTYFSHRIGEEGTTTNLLDRTTGERITGAEEIAQTWTSRTQEGSHDDGKIEVEDLTNPGSGSDPRPGTTGNKPIDPFAEANPRGGIDIGNQPEAQPGVSDPKPQPVVPEEPRIGNGRPAGGTELSERISEPVKEVIPERTVTEQPSDIAGAGRPDADGGVFGKGSPLTVETETGTTTTVAGSKTAIPKMADKPAGKLTETTLLSTYSGQGYSKSAYEYGALPNNLGNADASLVGPNNEQIAIKDGVAYKWEQKQVRIDYGNGYYSYQWQTQWVKQ